MDEWFFGPRMPKYTAELVYRDSGVIPSTIGKGLDLNFQHRFGFGYMQNNDYNRHGESIAKNDIGTTRTRYMANIDQTLFNYTNPERLMALNVGKIFFEERSVIAYSSLGIGRLIYQLPIPLCKMFIREIFDGKSPDDFDEETLITINKFFENSLNVSETSRQLYIHRNTLVYRLDKLQKSTGLDLRIFEDAITFKIALMVVKYMKYMENQEY